MANPIIKAKLLAPSPNKTIHEIRNEFLSSRASVTTGYVTQGEALDVAEAYQALNGGSYTAKFSAGRWNVVKVS